MIGLASSIYAIVLVLVPKTRSDIAAGIRGCTLCASRKHPRFHHLATQ